MNQQFNLSQKQMELLMSLASKKMGKNPEQMRQQLQSGDLQGLLGGLPQGQQQRIQQLMNDPAAIQQLISNPKVQQLLQGLMGK